MADLPDDDDDVQSAEEDIEIVLHNQNAFAIDEDKSITVPAWDNLPPKFKDFLTSNQIPADAFNITKLYRYIRYRNCSWT